MPAWYHAWMTGHDVDAWIFVVLTQCRQVARDHATVRASEAFQRLERELTDLKASYEPSSELTEAAYQSLCRRIDAHLEAYRNGLLGC